MSGSAITAVFLLLLVAAIAAFDLWVGSHYGADATISRVLRRLHERWPLFGPLAAFALGALYGHLFL